MVVFVFLPANNLEQYSLLNQFHSPIFFCNLRGQNWSSISLHSGIKMDTGTLVLELTLRYTYIRRAIKKKKCRDWRCLKMKNRLPCGSFVVLTKSSIFSISALRDARHQATENKASFWGRTFHGCLIKDFDAENRYEERGGSSRNVSSYVFTFVNFAAKYQVSYPLQQPTSTTTTATTVEFSKTSQHLTKVETSNCFCCSTMSRQIKENRASAGAKLGKIKAKEYETLSYGWPASLKNSRLLALHG